MTLRVFAALRRVTAAAMMAALPLAAHAKPSADVARWDVDPAKSQLGFTASQGGEAFKGRFAIWSADIAFDPDRLDASHLSATIDLTSVATGDRQRDAALPSRDWFNVKTTPAASFTTDTITAARDGLGYVATGRLTLRGVERPIDLRFDVTIDGDTATATGEATIVRTDYGVGQGEFATDEWVGLDVTVDISISAVQRPF